MRKLILEMFLAGAACYGAASAATIVAHTDFRSALGGLRHVPNYVIERPR
jgi:hypothetical protein